MPYKRKFNTRKTNFKNSNFKMHSIARLEARKVVNRSTESKFLDQWSDNGGGVPSYIFVGNSTATGAILQDLTKGIGRGAGVGAIIGDKITPTAIRISGNCYASSDDFNYIRIVVIQVKGSAVPTATQLLDSTGNVLTPWSAYDADYRNTYRVLHDSKVKVTKCNSDFNSSYTSSFSANISAKKLRPIHYTTLMDIETGGVYMYAYADSGIANPFIGYHTRIWYKDA